MPVGFRVTPNEGLMNAVLKLALLYGFAPLCLNNINRINMLAPVLRNNMVRGSVRYLIPISKGKKYCIF